MSAPDHLGPQFDQREDGPGQDQYHSFDVEVSTNDLLRQGVTRARLAGESVYHHRVNISAEYSHAEAEVIAAQMRAVTSGGMPTAVRTRL